MAKFIVPDLMKIRMIEGFKLLNITVDVDGYFEEVLQYCNTPNQIKNINTKFGSIIPEDLPVFIMDNTAVNAVSRKYGLPENNAVGGGIIPEFDTKHEMVLLLAEVESGICPNLVNHELVHYRQMKNKELQVIDNNMIWEKNGEKVIISAEDDCIARSKFSSLLDYIRYELKKPWEVEAYSKTMLPERYDLLPEDCKRIIDDYREKYM